MEKVRHFLGPVQAKIVFEGAAGVGTGEAAANSDQTTQHNPPKPTSHFTFAEACQGLSRRQALNKPNALLTLRFCSSSKRPSSSSVSALGLPGTTFSIDDGGDEEGCSTVFFEGSAATERGSAAAAGTRGSRLLQSRQFKAFLKQALECHFSAVHRVEGGGERMTVVRLEGQHPFFPKSEVVGGIRAWQ